MRSMEHTREEKSREEEKSTKLFFKEKSKTYVSLVSYKVISNSGPRHKPSFKVGVKIKNTKYYYADGLSKKKAEQSAANLLLKTLNQS